jgi:hypothetical protein
LGFCGLDYGGTFDGQGYEIRDLFINRPDEECVGLFGEVDRGAIIKNIGVVNVTVIGEGGVGGLVGENWGTVSNCYCTGYVTGHSFVGGLVGENLFDTVSNSYSGCSIAGYEFVGGLVGYNYRGTVRNSCATGSVTGNSSVGGLVGENGFEGTVSKCYSSGSVTGNSSVGGLVGTNSNATVSNCFWDTETSGQAASAGGTDKSTAEMQDMATFSGARWSIIAVAPESTNTARTWNIVDRQTYPFLSWQAV